MEKRLTHNLGLKILAVVLAVFSWLIMVNVSNPMMTATQTIPVEMINSEVLRDAGITYELLGRDTVTVSYKVHIRDQYRINAEDFYASADLAQLYDVTGAVPVQVEVADPTVRQFLISDSLSVNPQVVRVQTEPLQTKSFTLNSLTEGEPESGYAVGDISLSPSVVYAVGAESAIGQISSAGVEISVDSASTDLQGQTEVHFYDANNHILELGDAVSLSASSVNYEVTVLRVKDLMLDFQVEGEAASGYRYTGVTSDVQSVAVEGLRSALADVNTLVIPGNVLNVEGATGNVQVTVNLADYLPANISLVKDAPERALVTMTVEPLVTRAITCDVGQIDMLGLSGSYRYAFDEQELDLRVRGLAEDLDTLRASDIQAAMDLHGLGPGEHQIELSVNLPEGFEFVGPATVNIRIEEAVAGAAPVSGSAAANTEQTAEETDSQETSEADN